MEQGDEGKEEIEEEEDEGVGSDDDLAHVVTALMDPGGDAIFRDYPLDSVPME